jgi:hypothetical protein
MPLTPTHRHILYRRNMPSLTSCRCTPRWDRGSQWQHEEIAHRPWIRAALLQPSDSSPTAVRGGCTPPPLAVPLCRRSSTASASCVRSVRGRFHLCVVSPLSTSSRAVYGDIVLFIRHPCCGVISSLNHPSLARWMTILPCILARPRSMDLVPAPRCGRQAAALRSYSSLQVV